MAGGVNRNVATGSEAMALRLAAALDARHRARGLHHFADRLNPLERYTDGELWERVRFDRRGLLFITDLLLLDLQSATNRSQPMPPILQVYAALRYYASGSFQQVTGDTLGLCQRSVSKALRKVTLLLNGQMATFIHFPTTQDEISAAKAAWYNIGGGGFPGIVGAVDGCAIRIQRPTENEDWFVNFKTKSHALNIQGICGADRSFIHLIARHPGSIHDSRIFRESALGVSMEANERPGVVLIGDKGYALSKSLLTPYRNPAIRNQRQYNKYLNKCRARIEQTFGIWKRKFHSLHGERRLSPERCCDLIVACAVLYNVSRRLYGDADPDFAELPDVDDPDEGGRDPDGNAAAFRDLFAHRHFNHL